MNKKELLEKELAKYHFYRGIFISFLGLLIVFSSYNLWFLFYNLDYLASVFSVLILIPLALILFSLINMGKLNLKWTANYKQEFFNIKTNYYPKHMLPKQKIKRRKKLNKNGI